MCDYPLRLLPGLIVVAAAFLALGRSAPALRIVLLLLGFVLVRDAMTPLGLWSLGTAPGGLWLRFVPDAGVLVALGVLATAGALAHGPRDLRGLVVWGGLGPRARDRAGRRGGGRRAGPRSAVDGPDR